MKTVAESISKVIEDADAAAKAWVEKNVSDIETKVFAILDDKLEEVVAKLVGFDSSWGRWELDHCNGRCGESAAGDWLRERAGAAVKDWLDTQAQSLPNLPQQAVKELRREYLKEYLYQLREQLRNKAVENAKETAEKILNKLKFTEQ